MVKNIINNLPNIQNNTNFQHTAASHTEGFENNMSAPYSDRIQMSSIQTAPYNTDDIDLIESKNENGEKEISVLSTIVSNEKPIPKKIPDTQGIEQDIQPVDKIDIKKYKLDWVSSIYIGSVSVIGLYIAYKSIKRTI
jgi:hypothetical protein